MSQHVYARLNGYHLQVVPRAPFVIGRFESESGSIDIEYHSPAGILFARLIPENNGGYKSKIDQNTKSLLDVIDIYDGSNSDDWIIETSVFDCPWPSGFNIYSNDFPKDPSPFDLMGGNGECIYIQQPKNLPTVDAMVGPNQTVVNNGENTFSEWVELEYTQDDELWNKRHDIVKNFPLPLIISMQCLKKDAVATIESMQKILRGISPHS